MTEEQAASYTKHARVFAKAYCRNDDWEDVCGDVLLKIVKMGGLEDKDSPSAYIRMMVINRINENGRSLSRNIAHEKAAGPQPTANTWHERQIYNDIHFQQLQRGLTPRRKQAIAQFLTGEHDGSMSSRLLRFEAYKVMRAGA